MRAPGRLRAGAPAFAIAALVACVAAVPNAALADDPADAGAASADVTLRKGDRGKAVRKVQRRLSVIADGVFGPLTARAVRRFQRRNDLVADGIVGPITRRALRLRPFSHDSVVHPDERRGGGATGGRDNMPRVLVRIAECESGGDPRAVSADGRYRGKYQFLRSTWSHWGGRGDDPARAAERHQDRIALRLYRAEGTAPWPSCSKR